MKKIIFATDYSEDSVAALKYAVYMGKMLKTDVIALHIYSPSEEGEKMECIKKNQEKLLGFCRDHLKEQVSDCEISVAAVKGGNVPRTILDFVRDLNVQMIIMGAGDTGTIKDLLLGSITKEMTEISPFPILAIPPDQSPDKMDEILFASTFEDPDVGNLLDLTRMFSTLNPRINVVHITHKNNGTAERALEEFKLKVEKKVSYNKLSFKTIHSTHVYETLQKTIAETKPDMVVISDYHQKSEINKVIKREKVKKMQSYTRVPLLTIPAAL